MNEAITRKRPWSRLARLGSALTAVFPTPGRSDPIGPDPIRPDPIRPDPIRPDPIRSGATDAVNHRHHDAVAVLTAARDVVRRGWTQNTWYVLQTPAGTRRAFQSIFPSRLDRTQVVEACLVGAVMHAAWQQSPRPEHAYPALDALWNKLLGGTNPAGTNPAGTNPAGTDPAGTDPADADPVGPPCSPPVRVSRVRDLTTWNDRRYRSKDEVLDLLDRTVARIADAG